MKKITIFLSLVLTVLFLSCKQEKVQNISYTIEQTRSSDLLNEYKIEEDENFWTSDIQGGKIWLTFTFKPNSDNEEGEEMEKRKYYGYVDSRDM